MSVHVFKEHDFEHPSIMFVLEDMLKNLIGGPLIYNPYYKSFNLKGDEQILDFGCGGGVGSRCLANLLNKGGHLMCVDLSSYWIKKAKRRLRNFPNVECRTGDIRQMAIPNGLFDVVTVFRVIHDIPPMMRQDTISTLSQKLKYQGRFFIKERITEGHGMPVSEIRTLLSKASLDETDHTETKSEYTGTFQKGQSAN